MQRTGLFISIFLLSFSSFSKEPIPNTISSVLPNKPYFIKQCTFSPKVSFKYDYLPINVVHADINNPIWGIYTQHPLSTSSTSISAKTKSNIFTKHNSPDYCSYATTIDVTIEIQPTIIQTTNLNNSFFTCINNELKKREENYLKLQSHHIEQNKIFLERYISKLEHNISTIYSTSNQSEFYNNQISLQVQEIVNQFNSIQQNEFINLNNNLNKQRDFKNISNCPKEIDYFEQFSNQYKKVIFK